MNNAQRTISIMDCTHCFAVPGERSIVDCINPVTGRGWYSDDDLEQIQARYPLVEIMLIDDHCSAVAKRQDVPVVWTETTETRYYEMFGVLPPAYRINTGFLVGEPSDHHAISGEPRYQAFRRIGGKYIEASRAMTIQEFEASNVLEEIGHRYYL